MYIPQLPLASLKSLVSPGKVIVIFGPRRVGKTTLLKKYLEDETNYLFVSGDDIFVRDFLSSGSIEKLKDFIGGKDLLVIDEAQYIETIGLNLKLIVDHLPHVRVIATGSSTFDLASQVGEPLTGRKYSLKMYPISQMEMGQIENRPQTKAHLESRLIYGSYPEVILSKGNKARQEYLQELVSSYLLRDILAFEGMQKAQKIIDLLKLLAFQIGNEVSFKELGSQLSMSKNTIEKYLDLLEQVFVIVNVRGFSRNLRKEVTKMSRYYFCDNGIRNTLINNFNSLSMRSDQGNLWENYLVMERIKKQQYQRLWSHNFFWRTYDQKELDWVEEREGKLYGYEFKWGKKVKEPHLWREAYPEASFECITPDNYLSFIA
ncbi:MAG: ATP-binding protein [Verrucomicrobia bacterium]|nr:ATP-binding protein [Verrucomicrobiota bacterium]